MLHILLNLFVIAIDEQGQKLTIFWNLKGSLLYAQLDSKIADGNYYNRQGSAV